MMKILNMLTIRINKKLYKLHTDVDRERGV